MFGHFENTNVSSISIYPAIFTRISLALVHSTQDVREYETRLMSLRARILSSPGIHISLVICVRGYYGGPKVSRHKQELHGTNKNSHGTNKNSHGTNENFTAQTKTSRHKQKLSRHKRKLHGTNKNSHGTNENFTAQTKTLTAEVNLTAEMAVYFTRAVTQSLKIWRNR